MIKNSTLLFFLFASLTLSAQNINIPDSNFKKALVENAAINTNGDGEISESEAEAYTGAINVHNINITDLSGIEYFTNITKLSCYNNELTFIDLSKNTALNTLYCSDNHLNTLDLSKNTALTSLTCTSNRLSSLDLSNNSVLSSLGCSTNQLTTLDLSQNTALTSLGCSQNQLITLNLSKNTVLSSLSCGSNQLTTLDLSQNTALTYLYCRKNQLTQLDVNKNTALTSLYCDQNQLNTLDVSKNIALNTLHCYSSQFTQLDVSMNTALTSLICSSNLISSLDLSKNTVLSSLSCGNNQLTTLDLSQNTVLSSLSCGNNQLTTLDLSQNTALNILSCKDNQFTSLDLSQNTALTELSCSDNYFPLSEINRLRTHDAYFFYTSDKTIFKPLTKEIGNSIDYTTEQIFNTTNFSWYNSSNDSAVDETFVKETDTKGIFEFLQEGTYYCKMTNATLTSSELKTEDITIKTADIINFPDANFKEALLTHSGLDANGDGEVQYNEAKAYSGTVSVINKSITDLTGIEYFTNITSLHCHQNQLKILDVNQNKALTELSCYRNQLTQLDISKNTALTHLFCHENQLTALDVSNNTALILLYCWQNRLSQIDASTNTALTFLDCKENQLTQLDVSNNTALTALYCNDNQLSILDVSQNTALTSLACYENQLTQLDVSNNTALTTLKCWQNQLTQLDVNKNTALIWLKCWQNQLTQLDISQNTALTILECNDNYFPLSVIKQTKSHFADLSYTSTKTIFEPLTKEIGNSIDYSREQMFNATNTSFSWYNSSDDSTVDDTFVKETDTKGIFEFLQEGTYYCKMTNATLTSSELKTEDITIKTADIINFPDANFKAALLTHSGLNTNGDNEIQYSEAEVYTEGIFVSSKSIIDLSGIEYFTNITKLNCSSNPLNSLDVSQNTALTDLNCGYNQLKILDVSHNTALTDLNCEQNQLAQLDISQNVALTWLSCDDNQLKILDVSQNKALTYLGCYGMQLTQLDVSQNKALTHLGCYGNPLNSLDVSQNTALTFLNCKENQLTQLDVSNNTALSFLDCKENQLTQLDVSNNTVLTSLRCYENQFTQLDVSNNTALTHLSCWGNQLTALDVSKNMALAELSCSDNYFPLSEINQVKTHFTDLAYTSNKTIFKPLTKEIGNSIDYSREQIFNATNTSFSWYNSSDDSAVDETFVKETDTKGIFEFLQEGIYYCKMANATLSSSELKTEDITVKADDFINFPDANFKAALLTHSGLNTNGDDEIQYSEAEAYTGAINVSDKSIADLSGIEYFINITRLDCYNNQLTILDISNNVALDYLSCDGNQLTQLDVSNNVDLDYLGCVGNQLTQLDVSKNTALFYLECFDNQLTLLDFSNNKALTDLRCYGNQLTLLDFSNNTALTSLDCYDNQLTQLDVSNNTALTRLRCYGNQLTQLDVSNNIALPRLYCYDNQLTRLDISNNTVLTHLFCYNNQLTQLDISNNKALTWLDCYDNQLTQLDISNNTALTYLDCDRNQLTQLDVSNNTALGYLGCDGNQLTQLDVSKSKALYRLDCNDNQITQLDISNNAALTYLDCYDNHFPLSEINQIKTHFTDLAYTSDKTIFTTLSKKVGETIDYSTEKEFNGTPTTFVWYNSLTAEVDETFVKETATKGVFKFLQGGTYHCKMANATLTSSELKTENITVSKKEQTIAFVNMPTNAKVNDVITLIANASSTLPVNFSIVSGTATLLDNQLTCTTEGSVQVKATQEGNEEFEIAEAIIEITVSKKSQTVAFTDAPATTKVNDLITLVADASSTLPVSYSIVSGAADLVGDQLTCTAEGSVQVKATQEGNEEFESSEAIIEITVSKKEQTVVFVDAPASANVNDITDINANASSGLEVTFELVSGIADITGNSITFSEVGTVEIKASQAGNDEYKPAETTVEITVDYATGIEEVLETSTQIYPNPVETDMVIKFSSNEERTIRIFDLQGRLKLQKETSSTSERLNLSNFKSGMYLMRVQAKSESFTYKIIKK